MIEPQTKLVIHYPTRTHVLHSWPLRPRNITVSKVRDLVTDPLTAEEFMRRPFVRRSRWLVKAFDHDLQEWRQFYLGCTQEFAAPSVLRVGVFETESGRLLEMVSKQYEPSVADRRLMVRRIPQWQMSIREGQRLGIFAPDMRIIRQP